jgi:hypothetical protein
MVSQAMDLDGWEAMIVKQNSAVLKSSIQVSAANAQKKEGLAVN